MPKELKIDKVSSSNIKKAHQNSSSMRLVGVLGNCLKYTGYAAAIYQCATTFRNVDRARTIVCNPGVKKDMF